MEPGKNTYIYFDFIYIKFQKMQANLTVYLLTRVGVEMGYKGTKEKFEGDRNVYYLIFMVS